MDVSTEDDACVTDVTVVAWRDLISVDTLVAPLDASMKIVRENYLNGG